MFLRSALPENLRFDVYDVLRAFIGLKFPWKSNTGTTSRKVLPPPHPIPPSPSLLYHSWEAADSFVGAIYGF